MSGDAEGGGSQKEFQPGKEVVELPYSPVPWLGVNTAGMKVEAVRTGDGGLQSVDKEPPGSERHSEDGTGRIQQWMG